MEQPLEKTRELIQLVESMEGRLTQARASIAERAFSMGCSAAGTPVLVVVGLSYLFGVRGWAGLALVLVIALMAAVVLVSLLTSRAQTAAARRTFELELLPELHQFAAENNLTLEQIGDAARINLPKDALLSTFLPAPSVPAHEE
jgi:hypothetical protein